MTKSVEVSAKRLDDAIAEACRQLGIDKGDATVEVLAQGGIFSKAKVRVSVEIADETPIAEFKKEEKFSKSVDKPAKKIEKANEKSEKKGDRSVKTEEKPVKKEEKANEKLEKKADKPAEKKPEKKFEKKEEKHVREDKKPKDPNLKPIEGDGGAKEFLQGVFSRMDVTSDVDIKVDGDRMTIDLLAKEAALIGQRGETLAALRYLTSLVVNKGDTQFMYIDMDSQDYRARRQETLARLAIKTADRAVRSGRKVKLEPMPSGDRRIIHSTLQDREDVICRSEGREPRRAIAVMPKK